MSVRTTVDCDRCQVEFEPRLAMPTSLPEGIFWRIICSISFFLLFAQHTVT
jgi:hypothetical protein